ncbi:MAG: EAL domain-containing protein [Planctomycetota bacterium]
MTSKEVQPAVLFVDDEQDVTRGLKVALRREPWRILTADSGEEALEILAEVDVDVIVSDERMPGLQGSELLTEVRRLYPDAARIILTGQASIEAAAQAINAAGVHRFLLKPCPPEEVAATIHELLEKREMRVRLEAWREARRRAGRAALEESFERTLATLWVAFQPILRASDGSNYGYEALVRHDDPEAGRPDALLALASELGREKELGRAIRDAVAARIHDAPDDATILVNVSPGNFDDPRLIDGSEPLASFANRTILELTERESLSLNADLEGHIQSLRGMGYRIALDDFGAGYAGLSGFALLAPDIVKLDKEMVRNIHVSRTKRELIRTMTRLSGNLGIETIAEGIERREEHDAVVALGCDLVQGCYYAKPSRDFEAAKDRDAA